MILDRIDLSELGVRFTMAVHWLLEEENRALLEGKTSKSGMRKTIPYCRTDMTTEGIKRIEFFTDDSSRVEHGLAILHVNTP